MKEKSLSLSRDVRKVFVHSLKFARMQFHMIISDAVSKKTTVEFLVPNSWSSENSLIGKCDTTWWT